MTPRLKARTPLRWQGLAFSAVALVIACAARGLERVPPQAELATMALLILLLGVPHGALDPILARRVYRVRTALGWLSFTLVYCALAGLVIVVWQVFPLCFLAVFLLVSIGHFSGDPVQGTSKLARLMYGGAIVVLPTLLHASQVTHLFSGLASVGAANRVVPFLQELSWPWVVGLGIAAVDSARRDWQTGLELAAVALLAVLAPPLVAFTIFFCGMHSARHILRTIDSAKTSSPRFLFAALVAPMAGTFILAALAWQQLRGLPLDVRLIQLVFVGLAALTLPHMAVVELSRRRLGPASRRRPLLSSGAGGSFPHSSLKQG